MTAWASVTIPGVHDGAFDVIALVLWVVHSLVTAVDITVWVEAGSRVVSLPSGVIGHR
jgi:hypothetical protein